jgi:hypothetical protein
MRWWPRRPNNAATLSVASMPHRFGLSAHGTELRGLAPRRPAPAEGQLPADRVEEADILRSTAKVEIRSPFVAGPVIALRCEPGQQRGSNPGVRPQLCCGSFTADFGPDPNGTNGMDRPSATQGQTSTLLWSFPADFGQQPGVRPQHCCGRSQPTSGSNSGVRPQLCCGSCQPTSGS